jgi:hypothetical protein
VHLVAEVVARVERAWLRGNGAANASAGRLFAAGGGPFLEGAPPRSRQQEALVAQRNARAVRG